MEMVQALPPEILKLLIYLLAIAASASGAALLAVLAFLAKGVLGRLAKIERGNNDQFAAFGKQLAAVKDLVTEDLHRHDVRITKLEEWRKGFELRQPTGHD